MAGEATSLAIVHGTVGRPRPAAELGALVILEGLLDLGAGVHDERPVLRDRLTNGTGLQEEALSRSCARPEQHRDVALKHRTRRNTDRAVGTYLERVAFEEVQGP